MALTHGSLFTGIGGFEIGLAAAGFETRWMSEIEPYCNRVLAHRFPEVPNLGDITRIIKPPAVDVISFGSPCQDLSVAGRRQGLAGARSHLFFEAARLIAECRPAFAIWENVPGALSSNAGRDFHAVLAELGKLGATDIAWRVFDSQYTGVPQQRRRIYLVADFGGHSAAEILFESEGCSGHPAPGNEAREGVAGALTSRARGAGGKLSGRGGEDDYNLTMAARETRLSEEVSKPLGSNATGGFRFDLDHDTYVTQVSPAMTSKWAKDSGGPAGDEVQNLTLIQDVRGGAHKRQNGAGIREGDTAYNFDTISQQAFIPASARGKANGNLQDMSPALTADSDRGDQQPVVFAENQRGELREMDQSAALSTGGGKPGRGYPAARQGGTIRRFTPVECERLQGFPDGHTCLCGADADIFACSCPDGPRYRAVGNAVSTTIPAWLGHRIAAVLHEREEAMMPTPW